MSLPAQQGCRASVEQNGLSAYLVTARREVLPKALAAIVLLPSWLWLDLVADGRAMGVMELGGDVWGRYLSLFWPQCAWVAVSRGELSPFCIFAEVGLRTHGHRSESDPGSTVVGCGSLLLRSFGACETAGMCEQSAFARLFRRKGPW